MLIKSYLKRTGTVINSFMCDASIYIFFISFKLLLMFSFMLLRMKNYFEAIHFINHYLHFSQRFDNIWTKRALLLVLLKVGLYDEIFLSQMVNFFFLTVSFQHLMRVYSFEM